MDFPGRILAAFLAVLLITLFPLQYVAHNIENSLDSHIDNCTEQLSDTIRTKGYLDADTYESFVRELDNTGELYDVDIEDIHPVTGEEVAKYDKDALATLSYQENEEHVCLDDDCDHKRSSASPLRLSSTSINSKPLRLSSENNEIQSFAAHSHTSGCYAGHRHTGGCYSHISLPTGYMTICRGEFPSHYYIEMKNATKQSIDLYNGSDGTTAQVQFSGDHHNAIYYVGDARYQSVYNEVWALIAQTNSIAGADVWGQWKYDTITLNNTGLDIQVCGQAQDETTICSQVITSIASTQPSETVYVGSGLNQTVLATYLDGHTAYVTASSTFSTANPVTNGVATLWYTDMRGNTVYCTKTVTVLPNTKSCPLGHPNYIGTLAECPVCRAINGITISNATVVYDGEQHPLPVGNATGAYVDVARYIDMTPGKEVWSWNNLGPIEVGNYPVEVYVYVVNTLTGVNEPFFAKSAYMTILAKSASLTGLTVTPISQDVQRYQTPVLTVVAQYDNSTTKTIGGYTLAGYNSSVLGAQTVIVSHTENGKTITSTTIVNVIPLRKTCPVCHSVYDLKADDSDPGCPVCKGAVVGIGVTPDDIEVFQGSSLPITVLILYRDGLTSNITSWTSNYSSSKIGLQYVDIKYAGYTATIRVLVKEHEVTCPVCGTSYPVSKGSCPVCKEKVTSIRVVPEEVTVNQYDTISLTVLATYLDGSTREVVDWSIDRTTSAAGVFTANVSYSGCTSPIKLTVISADEIICPICGSSYDSGEYPNGCPICSKTITAIEAYLTSGSKLIQFGSVPDIAVVLIFLDNHREIADSGYSIEGYDPNKMGIQTITVKYDVFSCLLEIEVVDTLATVICPNGHVYYLNEDKSDPGCPYCVISAVYEVVYYYDITYTYEILEVLYSTGTYYFGQNNYLNISVTKKELSLLKKMQRFSVKTVLLGRRKRFNYGGKVL